MELLYDYVKDLLWETGRGGVVLERQISIVVWITTFIHNMEVIRPRFFSTHDNVWWIGKQYPQKMNLYTYTRYKEEDVHIENGDIVLTFHKLPDLSFTRPRFVTIHISLMRYLCVTN